MTIYPGWCKVSCPTCNAKPYELCTAVLTLPKGLTLRHGHAARMRAYDETIFDTNNPKIRVEGEVLSPTDSSKQSNTDRAAERRDDNWHGDSQRER